MNRFRTMKSKKNLKETSDDSVRPSIDSVVPAAPAVSTIKPSKTFRLGRRKEEPEAAPVLDLSTALPSSDDFRTSLLMSGLSARFSMLREQDDPNSKIGKASDDSVLFPKRHSRLGDFGFQSHGLTDIAEVSSINGSIRPPFAFSRTESYRSADEYGTDPESEHTGSIMNRSKPGEGNNLFGGRQKVTMGNRMLYESDVNQSAFQKLRQREREHLRQQREQERDWEDEAQASRADSPPLAGYNRNRETSSTTSSNGQSNTRTSTAATSFISQNGSNTPNSMTGSQTLERSTTKTRRLYETGLENSRLEQQVAASPFTRIDTLSRNRTLGTHTPPPGPSPTFAPSQSEKWGAQMLSKQSMPNLRGTSPPPSGSISGNFDFGVRSQVNQIESKPFGMAAPPLSPPVSEYDELPVLAASVQPNDKGKATALGAFSKPTQPYDDNKYSQRQLQLQQGRETPPLRKKSPPRTFAPQQHSGQYNRSRAASNSTYGSGRSRSSSSAQRSHMPDRLPESPKPRTNFTELEPANLGTFFLSSQDKSISDLLAGTKPKSSPSRMDMSTGHSSERSIQVQRPPESQHPMNRSRPSDQELRSGVSPLKAINPSPSLQSPAKSFHADSPNRGPAPPTNTGLSGMIRNHMRTDSNTSSVYGVEPPAAYESRLPGTLQQHDYSTKSNPWDTAEWNDSYYTQSYGQDDSTHATNETSATSPRPSIQSPAMTTASTEESRKTSWEKEAETISHNRGGSTATQQEQQEFQNELATRRRRVQESMKSYHEADSRSTSPAPDLPREGQNSMKNNTLGLLKKKSAGSLAGRTKEGQSRAMKMLGIGNSISSGATSPGIRTTTFIEDNQIAQEEKGMVIGVACPATPPGTRAFRQARRELQRDRERQMAQRHLQKSENETGESDWPVSRMENQPRPQLLHEVAVPPSSSNLRTRRRTPSRERKPPPVTYNQRSTHASQESKGSVSTARSDSRPASSRDRSGSDASGGRSKSRTGRYRDDLAKAMAEGLSSSSQPSPDDLEVPNFRMPQKSPALSNTSLQKSPMPSPRMGLETRSRSNSGRSGAAAYFDSRGLPTVQTAALEAGVPRHSPAPFIVNPTPPLSGSVPTSPIGGEYQPKRKFSVNKSDISEPVFLSSTSRVTTVDLPPGASLHNGMSAPPIPPVNPRRRQTRVMFGMGRKGSLADDPHSMHAATQSTEEMSMFSGDEEDSKPKAAMRKLRKSSSEGGNLNARARHAAFAAPSPAMPGGFPVEPESPPRARAEGGMF